MAILIIHINSNHKIAYAFGQKLAELQRNTRANTWYVNPCVDWIDCACIIESEIKRYIEKCFYKSH